MKKLFSLGLTALMMLCAMTGFVKAQDTHTFTFNPPSGSTVSAGAEITVTSDPAEDEISFELFASMEEAQAATPSLAWDVYGEDMDGFPTIAVGKTVLKVAVNKGTVAAPDWEVAYAEYTLDGGAAATPKLIFPDLANNKYGMYVPFHAVLTYGGEDVQNFEVYYSLETTPSKEAYTEDNDEILRAVATDRSAEILLKVVMAPYFKAVAYATVDGEEIVSNMVELNLTALEVPKPEFLTTPGAVPANTVIKIKDNTLTSSEDESGAEEETGATILYSTDGETLPLQEAYYNDDNPNVFLYNDANGIVITEDVTIWAIAYKSVGGDGFGVGQTAGSEMLRGRFTVTKPTVNVSLSTEEWTIGTDAPTVNVTVPEGIALGTEEGNVAVKLYIYNDNPENGWEQIITASGTSLNMDSAIKAGHEDFWTIRCSLVKGNATTEAYEGDVEVTEWMWLTISKDGEKPATPTFSVPSGEVEKGTKVAIKCATEGATLYYTYGDETVTTPYKDSITITGNCAIRAMAEKDGIQSDIARVVYTVKAAPWIVTFTLTPAPGEIEAGTEVEITASETLAYSDFIGYKLYPNMEAALDTLDFNMTYEKYPDDGKPVPTVENPVLRVGFYKEATRRWAYGYFTYTIMKDIPMPVITPAGGEVEEGTEVEINLAEGAEGAKIYYTLDGEVPTKESTEYTEKIVINEALTIKAIAIKAAADKDLVSNVAEAIYTVKEKPVVTDTVYAPVFSLNGEVEKGDTLTITCATEGAEIFYALDTAEFVKYEQGIVITKDITVRTYAKKEEKVSDTVKVSLTVKFVANEGKELADVRIYPNPSEGEFNVVAPAAAQVEIFNAAGMLVKRVNVAAGVNAMRLENSGIYFVRVSANGQMAIKKVVIR